MKSKKLINEEIKRMQIIAGIIKEGNYEEEVDEVDVTGMFNNADLKRKNLTYFKSPEGQKASQVIKKLVSQPFDADTLARAIRACKFPNITDFEIVAQKSGLEIETLQKDNEGNGDYEVLNNNYTDQGAAITFFNNKLYSVG